MYALLSSIVFFVGCFSLGLGLSILSSQWACSKTDWSASSWQSALFAAGLTIVHACLPLLGFLRDPLMRIANGVGMLPPYDAMLANAYVLMLASWPLTVWTSLASQRDACVPTPDETAEFKQELQAHLKKLNGTAPVKPKPRA